MLSIIIPTYNRLELLKIGLNCIFNQQIKEDYEIIVLNDYLETEGTKEYCSLFPQIKYIFTGKRNLSGLKWRCVGNVLNIGVKQALGSKIILTCPEIFLVYPDTYNRMISALEPKKMIITNGYDDVSGVFLKHVQNGGDYQTFPHKDKLRNLCTDYPFCMCLNKQDFINVGGYDLDFEQGFAYDDTNFVLRMKNYGCEYVKLTDLDIVHLYHGRGSRDGLLNKHELFEKNRKLYEQKSRDIYANINKNWGVLDD